MSRGSFYLQSDGFELFALFKTFSANKDSFPESVAGKLEIWFLASFACRVKFGSTNTVGVSSGNDRTLIADGTGFSHRDNTNLLIINESTNGE